MLLKKLKFTFFYLIAFLPAVLLVWIAGNITFNIHRINHNVDQVSLSAIVREYLLSSKGEAYLSPGDGTIEIGYRYNDPAGRYGGVEKDMDFAPEEGDIVVYVFGSSPVASKPPLDKGQFRNFPDILEQKLNGDRAEKYKVYNLALSSLDSFGIKEIIRVSAEFRAPDLIVYFYEGGMDYENAYYAARIKRSHYPLTILSIRSVSEYLPFAEKEWWKRTVDVLGWANGTYLQTDLLNFFQALKLLRIDEKPFRRINGMIVDSMRRNVEEAVSLGEEYGASILMVTNPTNLEAKPFGIYDITQKNYAKGMQEKDFSKKFKLLMAARDSELFTGDLGPKTETRGIFTGFDTEDHSDVFVLDLFDELKREEKGFDYNWFYDYGHMRPALHELVAEKIYRYIKENDIV